MTKGVRKSRNPGRIWASVGHSLLTGGSRGTLDPYTGIDCSLWSEELDYGVATCVNICRIASRRLTVPICKGSYNDVYCAEPLLRSLDQECDYGDDPA